jgi:hypothetical protein
MYEMGRSFRAPPTRDLEQWAKILALFAAGFRFFSYRSASGPSLPDRLVDVEAFIRDNPTHPLRVAAPSDPFTLAPIRGSALLKGRCP